MAQPPNIPKTIATPAKVPPAIGFEVEEEEEAPVIEPVEPAVGPFPNPEDGAELMFLQAFQNIKPEPPDNRTTPRANPAQTLAEMDLGRRADIARDSLIAERPEMAGHIDQAWRSARNRISEGDYENSADLEKNYFADAEADREKHKNLMKRLADTPIAYTINAKSNTGKTYQIPRTGTAIDAEIAALLPQGSVHRQLLLADIDPEDPAWAQYLMGSENTPQNRASVKDLDRTEDPELALGDLRSLHDPVKSGTEAIPGWTTGSGGDLAEIKKSGTKRIHVYVPIMEDPSVDEHTTGHASFNLATAYKRLKYAYFTNETGGRTRTDVREDLIKEFDDAGGIQGPGLPQNAEAFADEELAKIDAEAGKKAADDIQRIKAQFDGNYTYNRDSDSVAEYTEGRTHKIRGTDVGLGTIPVVGGVGAMALPLRAIEGYVEGPDGRYATMSEGGGIEFIAAVVKGGSSPTEELLESGISRSADDLQRIAPSTAIFAPFWMAYKDWVLKNDGEDPVEGRRNYVFKRAFEIAASDRLHAAYATQYDPAGRMMMDGGRILLGTEWGERNSGKVNLLFGLPAFGGMLIEPDALQASLVLSGMALGGLGSLPGVLAGAAVGAGAGYINKGTKMGRRLTTLLTRAERFSDKTTDLERAFNNAGGRNMRGEDAVALLRKLQDEDTTGVTSQVVSHISERVAAKRNAPFTTDFGRQVNSEFVHMHDAANQAAAAVNKAQEVLPETRAKRAVDRTRREATLKSIETVSGLTAKQTTLASEFLITKGALKMQTDKVATLKQAQALLTDDASAASDRLLARPITGAEAAQFGKARADALADLQAEIAKIQGGGGSEKAFKDKLLEYQDNFGAYDNNLNVRIQVEKGHLQEAVEAHKGAMGRLDNSLREDPSKIAYREAERIAEALRQSDADNAEEFVEAYTKLMNEELIKLDEAIAKGSSDLADGQRRADLAEAVIDAVEQGTLLPKTWEGQTDIVDILADTIEEFGAAARAVASVEGKPIAESLAARGKTTKELVRDHPEDVEAMINVVRGEQGPLAVLASQGEHGKNLVLGMAMDARAGGLTVEGIESANRQRLIKNKQYGDLFWSGAWNFLTNPGLAMLRFTTTFSGLIRNSNIFTTDVSFLGDRFIPELQEVANNQKRETDNWFKEVGLIARFYGQKSPEAARSGVLTYLTSQQKITLPTEKGLIQTGYSIGGNQGFADPADSLFDFALQNFTGIGVTFQPVKGKTAKEVGDLANLQADKSQALQALVKAFVYDGIKAEDTWYVNQAVTAVGIKLNTTNPETGLKLGDAIRAIDDPEEKMQALSDLVITALIDATPKLPSGMRNPEHPIVDVFKTLEDGTRIGNPKTDQKLTQVILAGAHEWQWAMGVSNAVGPRLNMRQQGALMAYSSKGKIAKHVRTTMEVGDRVVSRGAAEDFMMVMRGRVTGKLDDKAFKPRDFGLKGPVAESTVSKVGYPQSMEITAIFKNDEGVNTARIKTDDGEIITRPLDSLTRTSAEFSDLDLIDGIMAYGSDLVKDRGVTKKKWYHLRDQWVQFQIHSYDEYGNIRIVPQIALEEWSSNFKGLSKDLSVTVSEKATAMAGFDAMAHLLNKGTNWWRTAVMFGPLGTKAPAQFVTQALGDIEFIAREQGYKKAFQIGLMSIPAWVPGAGPTISKGIQAAAAEASRPFGKKAPSILNSFVNNVLSDVATGVNETRIYTTAKGRKVNVNPAQLRREMVQAGVFDGGLTGEDSNRILYEAAQKVWDKGVKDHVDFGRDPKKGLARWFEIIRDTMDTATSRTKQLVWMDLRYNKGLSIKEAKRQMGRTVFNYDNSLSPLEAMSIAKLSAFYVYKKNAAAANLQAFVSPANKGLAARARQLFWPSRYKRVKAYSQFTQQYGIDLRRDPTEELEDPEEGVHTIDSSKQIERRPEILHLPDYALDRYIGTNGPLPVEAQVLARDHGQDWTTFSIGGGSAVESMVGLNFLSDIYMLMAAAGASALMPDVGVNTQRLKRQTADRFVDQLFPGGKTIAEPAIKRFLGVPHFQQSDAGVKVNAREGAMLEFMGMYDTMRVKPGKDNTLRSNHWLMTNGLFDPMQHAGGTFHRMRLLSTIALGDRPETFTGFGDVKQGTMPVELQIQQYLDPYRKMPGGGPRTDAFLRYFNLVDADFFNSTKTKRWQLKDAEAMVDRANSVQEEASERAVRRKAKKEGN